MKIKVGKWYWAKYTDNSLFAKETESIYEIKLVTYRLINGKKLYLGVKYVGDDADAERMLRECAHVYWFDSDEVSIDDFGTFTLTKECLE